MARSFGAIALVALAAASACKHNAKKAPEVTTLTGESTVLPRVPRAPPDAGSDTVTTFETLPPAKPSAGRSYVLIAPSTLDAGRQYPLVLVFHGDGAHSKELRKSWPFDRATGKDAFVVFPEGQRKNRTWDLETTENNADIAYVEDVIEAVAKSRPIDRTRIFGAGYSSGGFMVNVLACHRPKMFRAISSSAGGAPYNQRATWPNGFPKCPGEEPVAMLALHGESDGEVTPDSGQFSAEYWAYINGCNTGALETTGYPECRVYRGCPAGKAVGACSIPRLGHWVWDASAEASWTFFRTQSETPLR